MYDKCRKYKAENPFSEDGSEKQQKKVPDQLLVCGIVWGPLKIVNGIKLILDDQGNHLDSYTIRLESFRSFIGPLFCKPVTGQELYLKKIITINWQICKKIVEDHSSINCCPIQFETSAYCFI